MPTPCQKCGCVHRQPSRRALATRSWTALSRLEGDARRQALTEHFDRFPPAIVERQHTCSVR